VTTAPLARREPLTSEICRACAKLRSAVAIHNNQLPATARVPLWGLGSFGPRRSAGTLRGGCHAPCCALLANRGLRQPHESIRCETECSEIVYSVRIGPPQPNSCQPFRICFCRVLGKIRKGILSPTDFYRRSRRLMLLMDCLSHCSRPGTTSYEFPGAEALLISDLPSTQIS
jgi:hypothetical protein